LVTEVPPSFKLIVNSPAQRGAKHRFESFNLCYY